MTDKTDSLYTAKALIERVCRWHAEREMVVDGERRYTARQLNESACRIAHGLAALGVAPGQRVCFLGASSFRFLAAYLAVQKLGAATCVLQFRETAEYLAGSLARMEPRVVFCDGANAEKMRAALTLSGDRIPLVALDRGGASAADADCGAWEKKYPAHEPEAEVSPDDISFILLSSGSTGQPKGVVHDNRSFVNFCQAAPYLFGRVDHHTRFLVGVSTPFAAWLYGIFTVFNAGGCLVMMGDFTPQRFCEMIERERITMIPSVPTMVRMLTPEITGGHDLSSLRIVQCAGEPPTAPDLERARGWADCDIRCLYLASESAPGAAAVWCLADIDEYGGKVCAGRPIPGSDIKIIDPAGGFDDLVTPGEIGEIAFSGPTIARGYWKDEARTAEKFVGRWWRSGDLGRFDGDGHLFVVGRVDNVINTGGIKVYGEEIEAHLLRHPDIEQAAVIGQADPKWGRRIQAHIVAGRNIDLDEIKSFCAEGGLAGYKIPKQIVLHEALPVGVTGKLDRARLRKDHGN